MPETIFQTSSKIQPRTAKTLTFLENVSEKINCATLSIFPPRAGAESFLVYTSRMTTQDFERLEKAIGALTADIADLREHMLTREDFPQTLKAGLEPLSDRLIQQGAQVRAVAQRLEDVRTSLRDHK